LVLVIEMMKSQLKSININSFNERLFEDFWAQLT
jgi:hypothetical protein